MTLSISDEYRAIEEAYKSLHSRNNRNPRKVLITFLKKFCNKHGLLYNPEWQYPLVDINAKWPSEFNDSIEDLIDAYRCLYDVNDVRPIPPIKGRVKRVKSKATT